MGRWRLFLVLALVLLCPGLLSQIDSADALAECPSGDSLTCELANPTRDSTYIADVQSPREAQTPDAGVAQHQTYATRSGPKTEAQLRVELTAADYDGPWDVTSMVAAYQRAGEIPEAVTFAVQPVQASSTAVPVVASAPAPPTPHTSTQRIGAFTPAPVPPARASPIGPRLATTAPAPLPGWTTVFSDDFAGPAGSPPSSANWRTDVGTQYPSGPAAWGTGEVESMTSSTSNVFLDGNSYLHIRALRDSGGNWTSGRIETQRSDFQPPPGGVMRLQASIQMPNVSGSGALGYWPAFWMLGAAYRGNYWNWPGVGELDIMESINAVGTEFGTLHCGSAPGGPCNEYTGLGGTTGCSCWGQFHTYILEWDRGTSPETLRWFLDGNEFFGLNANSVDPTTWANATNHGFFVLLNLAMGGSFPAAFGGGPTGSTVSGGEMVVKYVAIYEAQTFPLTVTLAGSGAGTVTSAPAGITCGGTCSAPFAAGSRVTLSAAPAAGSTFVGWSGGGCTGMGACALTMNAATAVSATLAGAVACSPRPTVSVSAAPAEAGRLQLTVTTNGQNNVLLSLQFGNSAAKPALPVNAVIDIGSLVGATGGFTFTPTPGATQVTFVVRRATAGASTTVPMVANDICGTWPTLVGGGPGAF